MATSTNEIGRRIGWLLFGVLLVSCCGCVEHVESGDTSKFYNALWATAACLFGGLAATAAGWFTRDWSERLGWALIIGGVVLVIGVTPTIFFENTTIRPDGFFVRSGIWGLSTYDVKYAETSNISVTMEETRGRRGRKNTNFYLVCSQKAGETKKVPLNGACEEGTELILVGAAASGVSVVNATGGY